MDNTCKVSIIIPVYNAEKYIEKTIKSILNQNFIDFEVILINDGSTDNTIKICNRYASKNNRFKVFTKKNEGPAASRNIGLDKANGKYILFVDADDYLDDTMIKTLVNLMNSEIQLGMCGYRLIINEKKVIERIPNGGLYRQNDFFTNYGMLFEKAFVQYLWNKIYSREIIEKNNIRFDESIRLGEDILFNLEYISQAEVIKVIQVPLYNYVKYNNESITKNYTPALYESWEYIFQNIRETLREKKIYNENKNEIEKLFMNRMLASINNLFLPGAPKNKLKIINEIEIIGSNQKLLNNLEIFKADKIRNKIIWELIRNKRYKLIYLVFKIYTFL